MRAVAGAKVVTRGQSRDEAVAANSEQIRTAIERGRETLRFPGMVLTTSNTTEAGIWCSTIESTTFPRNDIRNQQSGWGSIDLAGREPTYPSTRATTATATTVSDIRDLLRMARRDARVARMPPDRRALYHRIVSRREQLGVVEQDLFESLKELRNNG